MDFDDVTHRVCPWWLGYFLLIPLRRRWQDPRAILAPFVTRGATVLEPGPGMGFFTLELARRVGPSGRVIAVDVQPKMLDALRARARRAGLEERIEARLAGESRLGVDDLAGKVDFVLAFAVVHELADAPGFFRDVAKALVPGGRLLVAEPSGHVSDEELARSLQTAAAAGLRLVERPASRGSRTALLARE
jgi:ubiquinone/menaquinone biosynthesis C-methylase UbiE